MAQSGDPPRRSEPESLARLIPNVLSEVGLDQASLALQLLRAWPGIVGPELAEHCSAEGIRAGVIRAAVSDSAWMQRIQLDKPRILAGLRAALGEQHARELRLHIARRTP
jgi:predicted nucleic acid-binding Zn ribbon protein